MNPAAVAAAGEIAKGMRERSRQRRAERAAAKIRLLEARGGTPIIGDLTARDLSDLATVASSPVITVPAALALLAFIGSSPRASKLIEEGVASISRGLGQGVAAGISGTARGLWDGWVWDPSEREGVLESILKVPKKVGDPDRWLG